MDMSKSNKIRFGIPCFRTLACTILVVLLLSVSAPPARADCRMCQLPDCILSGLEVLGHHMIAESTMKFSISNSFDRYKDWLEEIFFEDNLLPAMMMMTEQLTAVGMHQMLAVGTLMDAKIQLETQRLFQELRVRAIKDYQPSQNYCYFGTNIRSFSASEEKGVFNKMALNKVAMDRLLGEGSYASASGGDIRSRWEHFLASNCQVYNNNWDSDNPTISGLQPACGTSKDSARANADVKYGRFVENTRTIDVDFTDNAISDEEEDIIALSRNLYGHVTPSNSISFLDRRGAQEYLLDQRAITAKRNVALNSYNSIVGMKSSGTSSGAANATQYMASVLQNLGITDPMEIQALIGEDPSYLAQMEILAKRVYQDQSFYANLYDKPQNVERTSVAMRALEVMVEREMFESRLRKEMLISVLLSAKLSDRYDAVESALVTKTAASR